MSTFPSRREPSRGGSWANQNPLPKTFGLDEPSKYSKRAFEEIISYPSLKIPRMSRGSDPLPTSPPKPPSIVEEESFTKKPAFAENAGKMFESEIHRDARGSSSPKASESWRADPPSSRGRKSEEIHWDDDYPKQSVEREDPRWRRDRRGDFDPDRMHERYSPVRGREDRRERDFFDAKQRMDVEPANRGPMFPDNRNQGSYEKLMKVVMGSINPRAPANPRLTDMVSPAGGGIFANMNREGVDGYGRPSLDAERYSNSRFPLNSFAGSSLSSSLSGKAEYLKDIPNKFDSSSTGAPHWESWRNPSNNQSNASSQVLNSFDRSEPPSDSWRTGSSKSESWRNVSKPVTESSWVRPSIPSGQDRFSASARDMRVFGPALVPVDRPFGFDARGYPGPGMDRNFRR